MNIDAWRRRRLSDAVTVERLLGETRFEPKKQKVHPPPSIYPSCCKGTSPSSLTRPHVRMSYSSLLEKSHSWPRCMNVAMKKLSSARLSGAAVFFNQGGAEWNVQLCTEDLSRGSGFFMQCHWGLNESMNLKEIEM